MHGTRTEHGAVTLTHHSISSTLNQVSLHGTAWTYQLIQNQLTTLNLDIHLYNGLSHSGLAERDFACYFFTGHFFLVKNSMFSSSYSGGRGKATNVCFPYQEQ